MCSVLDVKAKAFLQPFFVPNVSMAVRSFGDAVLNPDSGIAKHPEDYNLYKLGTFDDNSGRLDSVSTPEFLSKAVDFVPGAVTPSVPVADLSKPVKPGMFGFLKK